MADLEAQMALFQAELQAVEQPHLQMPLMPPSHGPPGNSAPQMMHNQSRQGHNGDFEPQQQQQHQNQHQQPQQQHQIQQTHQVPSLGGPMAGQNGPQMEQAYMMGPQQTGPMQQQYPQSYQQQQQQPQQQTYNEQQMMGNTNMINSVHMQMQQQLYQMGQGMNMSSMRPNAMQMPNSMTAPPPDMLKGNAQHNGMGSSSMGSGVYQSNMGMQQQRQAGAYMAGPNRGMMSSGPQMYGQQTPADPEEPAKGKDGKEKLLHKGPVRAAAGERWRDPTLDEWPENDFRVFVGDLGNEVNDEHLSKAFGKYASFAKAKIVRDKKTKKSKGFGFVSFTDGLDFAKAMREMQGKYIGNRPCKLTKSSWDERNAPPKRKGEGQHSGNASKRAK